MTEHNRFSIIIPTYNRAVALEQCLQGIARLEYPRALFEAVVVNDGGNEIPHEMRREFERQLDVEFVMQAHGGAAAARNRGAAFAKYGWLVFLDDDCVPAPDWLTAYAGASAEFPNAVYGGMTVNGLPKNRYAQASQLLSQYVCEYYLEEQAQRAQLPYVSSNNFALARAVFEQMGGFDETMRISEDRELSARLVARGMQLRYVPAAQVAHFRPMDFFGLMRQHIAYGGGAFDYRSKRKRAGENKLQIEPFAFYFQMLNYPRKRGERGAMGLAVLIALAQGANVYGFFREMVQTPDTVSSMQEVKSV